MQSVSKALSCGFLLVLAACGTGTGPGTATLSDVPVPVPVSVPVPVPVPAPVSPSPPPSSPIVARARLEVARGVAYDTHYAELAYPNGDVAPDRGVCTDVVVRALRTSGVDLQQLIHEDVRRRPAAYGTVVHADRNIDHRRVAPMLTYLLAHATVLPKTFAGEAEVSTWEPGDIVVWGFRPCPACTPDHVGIVSDRKGSRGMPLVIHNIGPQPSEDDHLDAWTILGHFRIHDASSSIAARITSVGGSTPSQSWNASAP